MELVDIKMLRTLVKAKLVTDLKAVRDKKTGGWKINFSLQKGKKMGVKTAIQNEKVYAKLDTLISQTEDMLDRKINVANLL